MTWLGVGLALLVTGPTAQRVDTAGCTIRQEIVWYRDGGVVAREWKTCAPSRAVRRP